MMNIKNALMVSTLSLGLAIVGVAATSVHLSPPANVATTPNQITTSASATVTPAISNPGQKTQPMSTTDGQMNNSQHQQGMSGTHRPNQANDSSTTQQSSGNIMMGSPEKWVGKLNFSMVIFVNLK